MARNQALDKMRGFIYKYGMTRIWILPCLLVLFLVSNGICGSELEKNEINNAAILKGHELKDTVPPQDTAMDTAQRPSRSILSEGESGLAKSKDKDKETFTSSFNFNSSTIIQIDNNPVAKAAVEKSISLFTERIKDRFSLWLSRSGRYLELMKDILKSKNIPEDIAFLPLIESGFNPIAYSVAKAVGPWQFIASTAKRYGLKIDWWRDERRDPIKSTMAAADYLKDLYDMFGSWNLAMAAYNAGEGKILKALNRTKKDDYWELTSTGYIKKETKEYVPRFVAARLIAANPDEYGFGRIDYHEPFEYDEVVINHPLDLDIAARCAETTVEVIRELNPELRRWSTPPGEKSYTLRIPSGKKETFLSNLSSIPEEEWFTIEKYKVKKGDTIKKIASRTGIPVSVILELNDLKSLKAGETIYLPPVNKFRPDRDDIKKISHKNLKKGSVSKKVSKKAKRHEQKADKKKIIVAESARQVYID
jgi:membrane-bound lytic murein transglycosylase D